MVKPTKVNPQAANDLHALIARYGLDAQDLEALVAPFLYPVADEARTRLIASGAAFLGNDNIAPYIEGIDMQALQAEVELSYGRVMKNLLIDVPNDHNSKDTPKRVAKMLLHETWVGRYQAAPEITDFPNVSNADQLIIVKNLKVESLCSHHHQNIRGVVHIGVLPSADGRVMGLSKYARIVRWFSRRPQIQEELTVNIAEYVQRILDVDGVIVVVDAEHQCMSVRGVCEHGSSTQTTHLTGIFRDSPALRQEFLSGIASK